MSYKRKIGGIGGILIGVCAFVTFGFFHLIINSPIVGLYSNCSFLNTNKNNNDWRIADVANLQASVLWEKTVFKQDALMDIVNDSIVVNVGPIGCQDDNHVVAFDGDTGQKIWSHPAEIVRGIAHTDDSLLVILCCTSIVKLDNEGSELWMSSQIPARIYRPTLSVTTQSIYLPTASTIYEFSLNNGQGISTIDAQNALAAFGDFALVNPHNKTMEVENLKTDTTEWTAHLPEENTLSNYRVFRLDNVVVIAWSLFELNAYNLIDGRQIWDISGNYLSTPASSETSIFTYGSDGRVTLYNSADGDEIGAFTLFRASPSPSSELTNTTVGAVLAASENKILVWDNKNAELIAIGYQIITPSA